MQDMDEEKDESIESQCLSSSNLFSSNEETISALHIIVAEWPPSWHKLPAYRGAGLPLWKWQRMWQWHSFEASRAAMFHTSWQRIAILHFCEESEPLPTGKEKEPLISSAGRKEGSFWRRSQIPGEPMESTSSSQIAAEKNEENNSLLRFHSTSSKWFIEKCRWIRKRLKLRTRCRWYWHWGRQRRSRGTSRGTLRQVGRGTWLGITGHLLEGLQLQSLPRTIKSQKLRSKWKEILKRDSRKCPPFKFTEYQVERPNVISAHVFAPADAAFARAVLSWDYTKVGPFPRLGFENNSEGIFDG